MNSLYTETGYVSLIKYGEYLCGDKVEIIEHDDNVTLVLADGLGSGVKANILATLTSKIICTMMSNGMSLEQCVDAIARTLPVCTVRNIAYSTFTIIQVSKNRMITLIQFDNPACVVLRDGKSIQYDSTLKIIGEKKIYESHFKVQIDDVFVSFSDGAEYAGVGKLLNFGWQRKNIIEYLELRYTPDMSAKMVSTFLAEECNRLYGGRAGDDTTIATVKIRNAEEVNVMFGPPKQLDDESKELALFFSKEGKKIVCGGTTSKIVADYLGKSVSTSIDYPDRSIPPIGHIEGIDLVTEGIVTMSKVLEYAKEIVSDSELSSHWKYKQDGASLLSQMLFEYATEINFFVGTAINPAHQNPDLPYSIGIKLQIIKELNECLNQIGKKINVFYY